MFEKTAFVQKAKLDIFMWTIGTCDNIEAGLVEGTHEQLESDDGVDDDDEEAEEGDVHQGDDRHQDGIHHNLQTCDKKCSF